MQSAIEDIVIDLEIARDHITDNDRTICIGLFDDNKGANALAYGSDYILFGARLLQQMAGQLANHYHDAFYPILYHEFAHILQNMRGETYNYILPFLNIKNKELQADCIAGALLQRKGKMNFNQYLSAQKLISHLSDEHIVGDHGVEAQRKAALAIGIFSVKTSLVPKTLMSSDYFFNACSQQIIGKLI